MLDTAISIGSLPVGLFLYFQSEQLLKWLRDGFDSLCLLLPLEPRQENLRAYSGDVDGTGHLLVALGWIIAQVIAFGIAVKGTEEVDPFSWEMGLYVLATACIVGAVVGVICGTNMKKSNGVNEVQMVRKYDYATIKYGRWVLLFVATISVGVGVAGATGNLPTQTNIRQHNYPATVKNEDGTIRQGVRSERLIKPSEFGGQVPREISAFLVLQKDTDRDFEFDGVLLYSKEKGDGQEGWKLYKEPADLVTTLPKQGREWPKSSPRVCHVELHMLEPNLEYKLMCRLKAKTSVGDFREARSKAISREDSCKFVLVVDEK